MIDNLTIVFVCLLIAIVVSRASSPKKRATNRK
jgi:hypothetical protein